MQLPNDLKMVNPNREERKFISVSAEAFFRIGEATLTAVIVRTGNSQFRVIGPREDCIFHSRPEAVKFIEDTWGGPNVDSE